MNKKRLYRAIPAATLLLSVGALTAYAETNGITYRYIDGSSYTYNSQGMLTITNEQDSSQSVVIDTNDIYANAEAIEEIQKKLIGLGGGNLGYDNTSNTYYIDIDGDRTLNESVDVLIGAVGSATTDMVLEGYTFSSQEAGVNKSGTMVDVLGHNNVLTAGVYTPSGSDSDLTDGSISLAEGGSTLSEGATDLNVGVGESVTLPSGYYSSDVTVGNGVVNRGTANAILTSSDNTIVLPAGYYNESTITTNITSLSGTISYLHHQCSNSEVDITYEDDTVGATNANSVNEKTVNGEVVSDTQGGCYTTPYYYYYEMKTWTNTYTNYVVGYTYDGKADNGQAIVGQIAYQRGDGITRYMGVQLFESEARQQYAIGSSWQSTERVTGKKYSYGTEYAGTLVSTYYLKTCGHTNGELLSVTVTY